MARALRLNEDLTEAIGLGHDLGHPPFGHIGEDVLDRAGRERFGRGFRHNEHSLRVVEVLEDLNLTAPVRDGILRHSSGAGEPATLEGKIVRLVDRIAYINHDIDDALRAGVIALGDLPARRDRDPRRRPARAASTRSCTTWSSTPSAPATSCRASAVGGGDAAPARVHVRARLPRARPRAPSTRRIERVLRGLFDWYVDHPDELPAGVPGASEADRVIDYLAGMTDRFAIRAWTERFVPAGPRELMARYTDDSRERVRDAVDFVELVGARTELKQAGPRRMTGLCPFHDERTPSFGIDPVEKLYHCFGCGAGGDVFKFAMETEGLDFAGALEWLAERANVELEREAEDPREAERRGRRERLLALLERTAAYYVRVLWESAEAAPARAYLAERGLEEGALREFRVGFSPRSWDRVITRVAGRRLRRAGAARRRARVAAQGGAGAARPLPRPDHVPARRPEGPRARLRRAGAGARRPARSTSTRRSPSCSTRAGWSTAPTSRARRRRGRAASCSSRATPT